VVEIPSDVVDREIDKVTARYGKSARLPGFRPGRVPSKVVRQLFRGQILQDAAEHLIGHAVQDALTERGVEPLETPDIRDLKVEEGRPLTFTASFDVVPSFDPGDGRDIEVRRPPASVEDDAIGHALERLRQRAARSETVEGRVVEAGHTVVLDLVRRGTDRAGVQGAEEKHDQVSIELGAPANPPGFDDALLGMTVGETRTFTLTYPDDYSVSELAGGRVDYTASLRELKRRVVPALDDEFAKDLGEFDSLDALRARVRADLEAEAKEAADRQVRADVLKKLAARVPFTVPTALVDREVDRRVEDFARRLMDQRIDPRQTNIDWAAFRDGQKEPAADAVKSAMVLDELARRGGVTVSEEDVDAELQHYADSTGRSVAALRARLQQDGELPRFLASLRRDKALATVMSQVRVVTL
jgi:trigger factor